MSRTIAFFTASDRAWVLPVVARHFHQHRRGVRLDHQGEASTCHSCESLTDCVLQCLGGRAAGEGWAAPEDARAALRCRKALRSSVLADAWRMYEGETGGRSRPDRDAAGFESTLREAEEAGALGVPSAIAVTIIEYAIRHANDPFDQAEAGSVLPFTRMARSLARRFDRAIEAAEVASVWSDIEAWCSLDAALDARLDRLVRSRGDRSSQASLWTTTSDGEEVPIDAVTVVQPVWTTPPKPTCHASERETIGGGGGTPCTSPAGPPAVVDLAVAELSSWLAAHARKPNRNARRVAAGDSIRAAMHRLHPDIAHKQTEVDRYLHDDEPLFAEMVAQVLAEAEA